MIKLFLKAGEYLMNVLFKQSLKFLWTHILSLALTVFLFIAFGWAIEKWGMFNFSIATSLFYISLIYSDAWNFGRIEGKAYNEVKESPLRAVITCFIPMLIGLIFILLIAFDVNSTLVSFIAKVWYMPFLGFYKPDSNISVLALFASIAVLPITSFIAYFAGMKNFSVLDKISALKRKKK